MNVIRGIVPDLKTACTCLVVFPMAQGPSHDVFGIGCAQVSPLGLNLIIKYLRKGKAIESDILKYYFTFLSSILK